MKKKNIYIRIRKVFFSLYIFFYNLLKIILLFFFKQGKIFNLIKFYLFLFF